MQTLGDDSQQVIEAVGDAIILADTRGAIRTWNPAAERLFGFTAKEAIGNSLDLVIPERFRERHWAGYAKTMATGRTQHERDVLRVPAVHKDGRTLSIAFTVGLLHGPRRQVTGIVAVVRDETVRFAQEQNLRQQLAELRTQNKAAINKALVHLLFRLFKFKSGELNSFYDTGAPSPSRQ